MYLDYRNYGLPWFRCELMDDAKRPVAMDIAKYGVRDLGVRFEQISSQFLFGGALQTRRTQV